MCVHYIVDTLELDVCLVKFCEDILSVVDICLLLVVQEYLGSVSRTSCGDAQHCILYGL